MLLPSPLFMVRHIFLCVGSKGTDIISSVQWVGYGLEGPLNRCSIPGGGKQFCPVQTQSGARLSPFSMCTDV